MEALKRSIRFQFIEAKNFLLGFWITMILGNILFYFLNGSKFANFEVGFTLANSQENFISVAGVNFVAIVIAMIAHNYDRKYKDFPLSQSLSMTRKNYFKSLEAGNLVIALVSALIQAVLLKIDPIIMTKLDKEPLYNFINFNLKTDNILFIIFTLFLLFLTLAALTNLLTTLNYKFGYMMWIVILVVNAVLIVTGTGINLIDKITSKAASILFTRYGLYEILIIGIGLGLVYFINYLLITNTNVKKKSL